MALAIVRGSDVAARRGPEFERLATPFLVRPIEDVLARLKRALPRRNAIILLLAHCRLPVPRSMRQIVHHFRVGIEEARRHAEFAPVDPHAAVERPLGVALVPDVHVPRLPGPPAVVLEPGAPQKVAPLQPPLVPQVRHRSVHGLRELLGRALLHVPPRPQVPRRVQHQDHVHVLQRDRHAEAEARHEEGLVNRNRAACHGPEHQRQQQELIRCDVPAACCMRLARTEHESGLHQRFHVPGIQ
mmetsp:Transcript_5232/g.15605  ORF Transcript_5232/g.15605 Transcript_5232/m.15605 type:complete len:243 (-) Transcript_5232:131-859(-)